MGSINLRFLHQEAPEGPRLPGSRALVLPLGLNDYLDTFIFYTNIDIIGIPKEEEREKREENPFEEIMAENYLNLGRKTDTSRKQRESQTR